MLRRGGPTDRFVSWHSLLRTVIVEPRLRVGHMRLDSLDEWLHYAASPARDFRRNLRITAWWCGPLMTMFGARTVIASIALALLFARAPTAAAQSCQVPNPAPVDTPYIQVDTIDGTECSLDGETWNPTETAASKSGLGSIGGGYIKSVSPTDGDNFHLHVAPNTSGACETRNFQPKCLTYVTTTNT
jgi:hypothetical protein